MRSAALTIGTAFFPDRDANVDMHPEDLQLARHPLHLVDQVSHSVSPG